ncbi:MAG: pyridoxal phosphate-dependent aminotransferase [bacterium]
MEADADAHALSRFAASIKPSPILTFAAEINARKQRGETLHNLTVGDFDASIFPIPERLRDCVVAAYRDDQTNYPGIAGMSVLRRAAADWSNRAFGLDCAEDEIAIASGARPIIYALYRAVVDAGERVVYPVPSWNNATYAAMLGAEAVAVETCAEQHFMPTAEALAPHLPGASLLALCAPQNPTGTLFEANNLRAICDLVVDENRRRENARSPQKPLYVMFDQVYWALTFGERAFHHPLSVCPQIRDYAVFVDGLSKAFAATGLRVGWALGPRKLLARMSALIAHIGAWAPKPEQVAAGAFLADADALEQHLAAFRARLSARLDAFHRGLLALRQKGHAVDAIAPQAAIYLSVKIALQGRRARDGVLDGDDAAQAYLLDRARIGLLPFSWFGARDCADWFRLSVGACRREHIPTILANLEDALDELS